VEERLIRVARLSHIEGEVNYQRPDDKRDEWFEATANLPLNERDQLYTGDDGRAEIQLTGGNIIRINRQTNLQFIEFNTTQMQFALSIGTASFRIESLDRRRLQVVNANSVDDNQPLQFEVDTPVAAVTFQREGSYRINIRDDGTTEVIVHDGLAEVYNREFGAIRVQKGRRIIIEGTDPSAYRVAKTEDKDWWDQWSDRRDSQLYASRDPRSGRYVPLFIPGVYDLDYYGDWIETPDYGWVWSPRGVAADWAPYRHGCWRWYSSYGWTWIAHEPWGWAPYHYGRWAYHRNRWCWVPRGVGIAWNWSPALVVFFGRGYRDGFNDGYRRGSRDGRHDWVGWVPLGPRDQFGPRDRSEPNGTVTAPRSGEDLQNFRVPGGFGGVEGRQFDRSRVVVHNTVTPPTSSGTVSAADLSVVEIDRLRPSERSETPRVVPSLAATNARGVVSRRTGVRVPGEGSEQAPSDNRVIGDSRREARDESRNEGRTDSNPDTGESRRPRRERDAETRTNPPSEGVRAPERAVEVENRPNRAPDFRAPERPTQPTRRISRDGDETPNRPAPSVTAPPRQESYPTPSRPAPREAPRRENPPPPAAERPRENPPVRAPDRPVQIERSRENSPPRESSPPRQAEKPPSQPSQPSSPPERTRELPSRPTRPSN
jgi:hypothetical protein